MPAADNSSTELAEAGESVVQRDSQLNSEFKARLGAMGSHLISTLKDVMVSTL